MNRPTILALFLVGILFLFESPIAAIGQNSNPNPQKPHTVTIDDLTKQCLKYDKKSCKFLAAQYSGFNPNIKENPAETFRWYEVACSIGDDESCYITGLSYRDGYGVPADLALAVKYISASCIKGLALAGGTACQALATLAPRVNAMPGLKYFECGRNALNASIPISAEKGGVPNEQNYAVDDLAVFGMRPWKLYGEKFSRSTIFHESFSVVLAKITQLYHEECQKSSEEGVSCLFPNAGTAESIRHELDVLDVPGRGTIITCRDRDLLFG